MPSDPVPTPNGDFDLPLDPVPPAKARNGDDLLIVPYRAPRSGARIVPAALAIVVALALFGYRAAQPDWHWEWPTARPNTASPKVAQVAPKANQPAASSQKSKKPDDAKPHAEPKIAEQKPPAPDAKAAIDDIKKEADRIRAQREELAKIKEREGKKIAEAPQPAGPRGRNAVALAQRQARIAQLMRQNMAEHQRRVDAMLRGQREFMARNGFDGPMDRFADHFGPDFAEVDRAFERMRREMDAFEREALAMRGDNNPPAPPVPGIQPDDEDDDKPLGQPEVRRFNMIDKNGNRVTGFQMRWSQSR
jgi:hypothetical protein